ncbi:hypothetical protein GF337_05460, partial [candidate division KSB1 bacterium]|nr:hypothetical protein [candidate division KSB1 bacterium]
MKYKKTTTMLVAAIVVLSLGATLTGILSDQGPGRFEHESIRGETVTIYGEGIYKHMSADVAIQGIAQDYVTLIFGIPLLLISFVIARKNSLRGIFALAGVSGYFLVTYLFYMAMGMYNELFLAYIVLTGTSFFAFFLTVLSIGSENVPDHFSKKFPARFIGGFLIFNSFAIAILWLSIVVPPLISGKIYPAAVQHYTTLIVQGMDLSLLLPFSFVIGLLLIRRKPFGYLFAPVYLIFLSLLMTALVAKIIGMAMS